MVTLITFAFCKKEGIVGVTGLELLGVLTDSVTGLDAGEKVLNKSIISDVCLDLVFDEQDDKLTLLLDS